MKRITGKFNCEQLSKSAVNTVVDENQYFIDESFRHIFISSGT